MRKRIIGLLLMITILVTSLTLPVTKVGAETKYIDSSEFIKLLGQVLKLEIDTNSKEPYLDAAVKAGIVKKEELKIFYFVTISRSQAVVFINRADEYLHGDTVKKELVRDILNKRISDIDKTPEDMREDVAKCFAKGIIKGYGNGYYIQNRSFKGNEYLTISDANSYIKLITNTSKRAKLSPDGQLIRTTNLPKNASSYEYILACYPNKFYEKKFEYMFYENYKKGERNSNYQVSPVQIRNSTFKTWNDKWAFSIEMDKYLYDWEEKAETYLKYLFNVNYKSVEKKWINGLASVYVESNVNQVEDIQKYYVSHMKKNKVVIESSTISVEPSTLYYDGLNYCMRAYVRYRIFAKDINVKQNRLIYSSNYPNFKNLKNGVWRTGIFDIRFGSNNGYQGDGSYFAISEMTNFNDLYNVSVE